MAFLLEPAAELVLSGLETGEATNIVQGAETVATQFKNELLKGIPFGITEGLAFTGAQSIYNDAQKKMKAKQNCPIKNGRIMKRV